MPIVPTSWFAIRTRSRQEQVVSRYLNATGLEEFLPLYQVRRRWSDRVKVVDVPLFEGYVFCRFDDTQLVPVLSAPGVVHVVTFDGSPARIPEAEIEAVRQLVRSKLPASPCPYLKEGAPVRIRSGPMKGVEGRLVEIRNQYRLRVSVHMLQRSVEVEIDPESVEALT
ncbi:UpxY family transcription antiterminator [Paludibaculum fermentans]|uniref:UpxY family transcription antiterminator n=1 Tax=Paludibaculum fermentans TaxID=1473598 RepID=UPI003EBA3075